MSVSLAFRPATPEDRPWLFGLYEDAMRPHIERIWGWDPAYQAADFEVALRTSQTLVVEADGVPAGYAQVEDLEDATYLRMLILHPDRRSQGLGARVLKALLRASLERGRPLTFRVFRINTEARRFYEREGWRVLAKEEAFHLMGHGGQPLAPEPDPGADLGRLVWD